MRIFIKMDQEDKPWKEWLFILTHKHSSQTYIEVDHIPDQLSIEDIILINHEWTRSHGRNDSYLSYYLLRKDGKFVKLTGYSSKASGVAEMEMDGTWEILRTIKSKSTNDDNSV